MYIIICANQNDLYCGTEAIICDTSTEVFEELKFINKYEVFNIYKVDVIEDVKRFFLKNIY